jgi:four helix bundle protein
MAKHFKELQCWQLADELRTEIHALCEKESLKRDYRFCNSAREAAGSVCRNLSEGFDRFESAYIVQFFGFALGSLAEVQDHLVECKARKVLEGAEFDRVWDLSEHTRATIIKFKKPHQERLDRERTARAPVRRRRPRSDYTGT